MDITFLGHSAVELTAGDTDILIDPFLTGNPKATVEAYEVEPTHILLSHGHAGPLRRHRRHRQAHGRDRRRADRDRRRARVEQGLENVLDPNFGGTVTFDWGWVKLVPAWHTSTTPNGTVTRPPACSITIGGTLVYHSATPRCSPT